MRGIYVGLLILALAAPAVSAQTMNRDGSISIMKPEPGSRAAREHRRARKHERVHERTRQRAVRRHYKERTSRGSSNPVYPAPLPGPEKPRPLPHYQPPPVPRRAQVPPPMVVPETGRTLPNLPAAGPGLGIGGKENFHQRATRCAHQAGVYGPNATGSPSGYINSCINQ